MPQRLRALVSHGLSESGARVYLTLLEHPHMTAATIAKVTGVPRSHLYKVLDDLHGEGLADILLESGSRSYRARPFGDYLERRAQDLRERLAQLETHVATLADSMRPPPAANVLPEGGEVRLILGRRMVARQVDELLDSARQEVIVGVSDHAAERVARHLSPCWESWRKSGRVPEVTVIVPRDSTSDPASWAPPEGGRVDVRHIESPRPALSFVVDGRQLLLVHPIPDSSDVRSGRDFAVHSTDVAFVMSQRGLLLHASRAASS